MAVDENDHESSCYYLPMSKKWEDSGEGDGTVVATVGCIAALIGLAVLAATSVNIYEWLR